MNTFKRYEKKYIINYFQYNKILEYLRNNTAIEKRNEYSIQNIYYDTEDYLYIRRSVEKPVYKEKLRLRCYDVPNVEYSAFLELKRKYKGVVYKRRERIIYDTCDINLIKKAITKYNSQISKELLYFISENQLMPKIYISYSREALIDVGESDLRITFDNNIRFRSEDFNFVNIEQGTYIIPSDIFIMEIKTIDFSLPLWLVTALNELKIYPTSFSKCGKCYIDFIVNKSNEKKDILINA